jgi:hypothetical protein
MRHLKHIGKWINEAVDQNTFYPMYHGGTVDYSKPMFFGDNKLIASSYGKITGPYRITFKKPVEIDFSTAEGWWLPEEAAKIEAKKLGVGLEYFDKYKEYKNIRGVKTDHFVRAAEDKGFDGIIFKNIMDAGSHPVKGDKYIRTTNIVAITPSESVTVDRSGEVNESRGKDFDEWFEGSVVVKKDGKPLLVYHASMHQKHSRNYGKNIPVLFFAKDRKVAQYFGDYVDTAYLSIKRPIYFKDDGDQSWSYITLKDIKNISDQQRWELVKYIQAKPITSTSYTVTGNRTSKPVHKSVAKPQFKSLEDFYKNGGGFEILINDVAEYAMKNWKGEFDGIVARNIWEGDDDRFQTDDYIPFSAEQIRFA